MKVLSPVGTFPVRVRGGGFRHGTLTIDASMGAWRSEVRLERADVPLLAAVAGLLVAVFAAGRASRR